jgi:type I restriction enzyme S subunit
MRIEDSDLADHVDFFNGKAPTGQRDFGPYPIFGSNGVIGYGEGFNHENGIILGRVGAYCGSVEMFRGKFWASDNTIVVKPTGENDLIYLYYRLKSAPLRSFAGGAAQPLMTHGILRNVRLPFANEDVQPAISQVLKSYDDLIANGRQRIGLLERSARLLFKEWFVRLRYPGHEHIQVVDGVPKGWSRKLLGEIAVCNALSHSARTLPPEINYIDISSVAAGLITQKTRMRAEDAPGRARRRAVDGDVIWSNVRPNLKQYALVLTPDDEDVFSTGFTILGAREVPFSFLYCAVTTDAFVAHLVGRTTGASYPAVRPDDFEQAQVLVPPDLLLREFHDQCEPMFRLSHSLDSQNKKLIAARDLLLPRLMDGRISV